MKSQMYGMPTRIASVKRQHGITLIGLLFGMVRITAFGGWVWNLVKLIGYSFESVTGLLIARVIGVVIPHVGAIVGFWP